MLAVGIWYVWSPRTRISDVAVTLMGPIYTGFMLSAIVLLRDAVPGLRRLLRWCLRVSLGLRFVCLYRG